MEYLQHAAAIVIRDKKILLIKRADKVYSEPGKWCPVNETIEIGEKPEVAIVRGVKEEIGVDFKIESRLEDHLFAGHQTFVFFGSIEGDINPNSDEVAEYGWFLYDDARKLVLAYNYLEVIEKIYQKEGIEFN